MLLTFASFSKSDWADIFCTGLVVLGCGGEIWAHFIKERWNPSNSPYFAGKKKHHVELISVCILTLGVLGELIFLPKMLGEISDLNKQTAQLTSSNLSTAVTLEEFRKKNAELELRSLPRAQRVVPETIAKELKGKLKIKVVLSYEKEEVDSWELAIKLQQGLQLAGWDVELRPFSANDVLKFPEVDPKTSPRSVLESGRNGPFSVLIVRDLKFIPGTSFVISPDSACAVLQKAIMDGGGPDLRITGDPSMPGDLARIVIGQKY